MRLRRIKIKHFRSHSNTVLTLQRVNFLRGLNRTGKSSVRMAIAMVLAGRCEVTDEAGKGFEDLIEEGAQSAIIVLEFDSGVVITLTLDRTNGRGLKIETDNRTILGRQASEWIAQNIAPPDVISACLDATRFVEMTENEQATLLARVLLPEKLPIEPEVADWLVANKLSLIEKPSLFATIEATFKSIANARTDVSRVIRDLKNIAEPDPVGTPTAEIKAKLRTLQEEEVAVNNKIQIAANAAATAELNREQITLLEQRIADLEGKLKQLPAPLIGAQRKKLQDVASLASRHAQLRSVIAEDRATLSVIEQQMQALDATLQKTRVCPTCKQSITEKIYAAIFEPLLRRQNEANAAITRNEKQIKADGDPAEAARELHNDTENHTERQQIEEQLDAARHKLETCQAYHPPQDIEDRLRQLKQDAATLHDRVKKGVEILVKAVELEGKNEEYNKQLEQRQRLEQRHAELERLLNYFGPTGIKARLISERLDTFAAKVNEVLAWWGYSMDFSIEPFILRVREYGSEKPLKLHQLSASESYRLGVAFAHAIAEWTGFRFLLADAAEILDKIDKGQLAEMLLQTSGIDQAVIFSTGVAGTFESSGTAFYTLSKEAGITACNLDAENAEAEAVTCP